MAERIEKVEISEQTMAPEALEPLAAEYTQLQNEAAQGAYSDMAEYYAQKKQALLAEQQDVYRQKRMAVEAEAEELQDSVNQWKIHNTTTYGMPKYASDWEHAARTELKNNGVTDWYKYLTRQADIAWEKEKTGE